mmetsp:Transcript_8954/g.12813  ORF Transcript_8954/g.12813 Transcript_8954/m.12813 type:complete len:89 (-) Transcript_8954:319-585(-)
MRSGWLRLVNASKAWRDCEKDILLVGRMALMALSSSFFLSRGMLLRRDTGRCACMKDAMDCLVTVPSLDTLHSREALAREGFDASQRR